MIFTKLTTFSVNTGTFQNNAFLNIFQIWGDTGIWLDLGRNRIMSGNTVHDQKKF
jgi:hypothetical protein